ncbi:uncharacterized protein B0H18DRAFT_1081890 [Fomitopsis serialis]|uniref:uncharacterized protein n=1 Tax=Fomitopsis serialis TaxID=139415 RepID=UPI002007F843|nr:uncharacterized protein B0H18DRAFT_1081890 [Neoantrodia serialis]KAH9936187.1 hypothetical protein B0H18DRAFT_1081890 [Neoantrodia serialis]
MKRMRSSLATRTMKATRRSWSKHKFVPSDETPERRNARTVFVGNVPVEVVKSRPLQKQLKRHFTTLVPTSKIESVRFRSVAFAAPTSKLPTADDDAGKGKGKAPAKDEKDSRQHDRDRTASWRAKKNEDEDDPQKQFLTPKEKKRVAFIKQELHSGVDAVNAYVVFAHPIPETGTRPKNVPPPAPTLDPYEAARLAAERCDGTVFMERTIRVDRVGRDAEEAPSNSVPAGDPKMTIFVGNLDFASKEEDLRAFFETLVIAERGQPGEQEGESSEEDEESDEEDETSESKVDKDTQMGKGFAYVQFVDRQCVDEVLALEESQLKFAKRKLRVLPKFAKPSPDTKSPVSRRPSSVSRREAPKGGAQEGQGHGSDRVARRIAKKQAKVLAEKGVKSKPRVERERMRKRPGEKKAVGKQGEKKKGRVRSGKALAKMNTKK